MLRQIYKNKYFKPTLIAMTISIILFALFSLYRKQKPTQKNTYPKILWIYWDKEELPHNIKLIKDYNNDKLKDWDLRYLNINTLKEYIPESAYHAKYYDLVSANKSDWIRLYLLYTYGGCWLDAGIIVNNSTALNDIYNTSVSTNSSLTVFKNVPPDATFKHVSGTNLPLLIDSWFILAPQGSPIVKAWLHEFTTAISSGFLNYKRKIMKEGTNLSKIGGTDPDDTYLMVHMCIQHVLQKKLQTIPPIMILDASVSMFKIQNMCNWDNDCLVDKLNNDPKSKTLPYIKLINSNRKNNIDKFFQS
jgi:hypothetical protein